MNLLVIVVSLLAGLSIWLILYNLKEAAKRKAVRELEEIANDCSKDVMQLSATTERMLEVAAKSNNAGILTSLMTLCFELREFDTAVLMLTCSYKNRPETILSVLQDCAYASNGDAISLAKRFHVAITARLLEDDLSPEDRRDASRACAMYEECIRVTQAARDRLRFLLKKRGFNRDDYTELKNAN